MANYLGFSINKDILLEIIRIRLPFTIISFPIDYDAQTGFQDCLHKSLSCFKTLDHAKVMSFIIEATRIINSKDNYF